MTRILHRASWVLLAAICATAQLAATDIVIKGTVTDNSGKPIRGATIRVNKNDRAITRYSQDDGRYEITLPSDRLPPGSYTVVAKAFGFGQKVATVDTSQSQTNEQNFSLSPKWDIMQLTGAEVEQLIPDNPETIAVKSQCTACHDFDVIRRRSGQTAAEWKAFLPKMTNGRWMPLVFTPERLESLSQTLGKYLGPDSPYLAPDADPPTKEQVRRPQIKEAALKATIYEWDIPTGPDALPHSITSDPGNPDIVDFTEAGARAVKFGTFYLDQQKMVEWPAPAVPHTGVVTKDGIVWEAMQGGVLIKVPDGPTLPHLVRRDPETGQMKSYVFEEKHDYTAHTPVMDHLGNVWLSVEYHGKLPLVPSEIWRFDPKTEKFKAYQIPVPRGTSTYHLGEDSKGMMWASLSGLGSLVRVNPETGESKIFKSPNTKSIRGMVVDSHDNIWYAAFLDHKLGKFDIKTETFKLYQPPTPGSAPYGVVEDKNTGYIWYGEYAASGVTRFDPKTEQFVEYPFPLQPSIPRFISVDNKSRIWFTEFWNGKIGYVDTGDSPTQKASR